MTRGLSCDEVLCSSVSDGRFLVIDPGTASVVPSLNGAAMFRGERQPCSTAVGGAADCELRGGQRYIDVVTGLTLLCIRPGRGRLCYGGRRLTPDVSRRVPLPAAALG